MPYSSSPSECFLLHLHKLSLFVSVEDSSEAAEAEGGRWRWGGGVTVCVLYTLTDNSHDFLSLLGFNEELKLPLTAEALHPAQPARAFHGAHYSSVRGESV